MKTTHNWLWEFCRFDLPAEELAHRLSMSGCLIEEVRPVGDDVLLVAEVTSNRPDLLGTLGIAREVCALTDGAMTLPPADFRAGKEKIESATSVEILAPELCPRYTARLIRGVKVGASPDWLRKRLEAIGLRPVNNVVDVTNYVLFEYGQPLHAFDFSKLQGRRLIVRRAANGEKMIAIDGTECKLDDSMLVIADAERAVAVAGVMGGLATEVSAQTTDILLESAQFHGPNIRRTSRALGLASDSSYRFERGVDPVGVETASGRAMHLIQQVAGGTAADGIIDVWAEPYKPKTITLRASRMAHVLGVDVPLEIARGILERLGFVSLKLERGELNVHVPAFRAGDVTREIDLIEEVIRIHGYDKIPERGTLPIRVGRVSRIERVTDLARNLLVGLGYNEVLTNSFCDEATAALVSPWTAKSALLVQNTIRRDENRLRVSLMPGLLTVKRTNAAHGVADCPIFEISRAFLGREGAGAPTSGRDALPEERHVLAVLDDGDLLRMKGALESLFESVGLAGRVKFEAAPSDFFAEACSGRLTCDGRQVGVLGEIRQELADRYDLPGTVFLAELDFDWLASEARLDRAYKKLPVQPGAVRDLAVIVDEAAPWAEIEACVRRLDLPILEHIEFFDIFRGKQVPAGKKSIAFSLVFRAPDRTLTSEEVEDARQKCINALTALGASLRQ